LSVLPLDFKLRTNLYRNIPAIGFVYQILERNDKVVGGFLVSQTVIVVVDGDETDAKEREYLLDIFSGIQVITAKAG